MQKVKKLSFIFGIFVLSIGLLAACGGGGGDDAAPTPEEQQPAEQDLVTAGEQQVQQSCIGCHGTDLQGGMGGAAPSLTTTVLSKEEIINVVTNGRGAMPGGTAQGNEEAVAEYILSLQ